MGKINPAIWLCLDLTAYLLSNMGVKINTRLVLMLAFLANWFNWFKGLAFLVQLFSVQSYNTTKLPYEVSMGLQKHWIQLSN